MSVYEDEFGPMELDDDERRVLLDLLDVEADALGKPRGHDDPKASGCGQAFSWPGRLI